MVDYERKQIVEKIDVKYGYKRNNTSRIAVDIDNFTWQKLKEVTDAFIEDKDIIPESIYFEFDTNYGYYESIDTDLVMHGKRWETDPEMNKRIANEEKNEKAIAERKKQEKFNKEANERKTYELLKKKFEGGK